MTAYIKLPSDKAREMCIQSRMAYDTLIDKEVVIYREKVAELRKTFLGRLFNSKKRTDFIENSIFGMYDHKKEKIYEILKLANKSSFVYLDYDSLKLISKGEE